MTAEHVLRQVDELVAEAGPGGVPPPYMFSRLNFEARVQDLVIGVGRHRNRSLGEFLSQNGVVEILLVDCLRHGIAT